MAAVADDPRLKCASLKEWHAWLKANHKQTTGVLLVLAFVLSTLPASIGQAKAKAPFTGILSNSSGINRLSLARWIAESAWPFDAAPTVAR